MKTNSENFSFFHETPIQIRFNDIDIIAHVNNAVYQNYFDFARMRYFENVFEEKINWKEQTLVLAKITIEYINPVFLEEEISVLSKVYKLGNKSLHMNQRIINSSTNEIKAENKAILVAFKFDENSSIEIPENWREKIIKFEKDIDF